MKYYPDKYDHCLAYSQYATLINCIFCVKTGDIIKVLNIYSNTNTYTLPLWAQVWRWWCVTSPPAVGSCSGPAAFLCLAPSAYTAAVYRCTSWAWPAGAAEHKADEGGAVRGAGSVRGLYCLCGFHLQPKDNFTYSSSENMIDITKDTCTYNQFNLDLIGVDVKSQRTVEVSTQLNNILKRLISSVKNFLL